MDNTLTQRICERLAFLSSFSVRIQVNVQCFNVSVLLLSIESTDSRREIKVYHVYLFKYTFLVILLCILFQSKN